MVDKIPKTIHYCWFGGNPLPELAKKCIASWKKYCPDYEIIEWNESNFDLDRYAYVREAYDAKKWAFVTDVVRLHALVNYGGIYMDTDVEVLRPLDDLLVYEAVSGFESEECVPTGLMACEKNQPMFCELLKDYDNIHFLYEDGSYDLTTNVTRITQHCLKYGLKLDNTLQTVNGLTLFPFDYFCPKNFETKITKITKNTYTIHHFDSSWLPEDARLNSKLYEKYRKIMPDKLAGYFAKYMTIVKLQGLRAGLKEVVHWLKRRTKNEED